MTTSITDLAYTAAVKAINFFHLKPAAIGAIRLITKMRPMRVVSRRGIKYSLDLNELIDFGIYVGGWEKKTIEFLKGTLQNDDVVIEVGANVGSHTLLMSSLVGHGGKVYAFEPTSFARTKLLRNMELNLRFSSNIVVRSELVSNGSHEMPRLDIRSSWALDTGNQRKPETVAAPCISIDEFAEGAGIRRLDLLKIDVDGYDFKVLFGAIETLRKLKPTVFIELCEYSLREQGDSTQDVFRVFAELGYYGHFETGEPINSPSDILAKVAMNTSINGIFRHKATRATN
jgi:FkbM family methyltransferase